MPIPIEGGFGGIETGFEPIPAGVYMAEVTGGEIRTAGEDAKYPGSKYIAWEFTITEDEYEGRKAWINTSLVKEARGLLKMFLLGVGFTEDELEAEDFTFDIEDIEGKQCRLVLKVGKNPKTQERNNSVRRVLPIEEAADSGLPS